MNSLIFNSLTILAIYLFVNLCPAGENNLKMETKDLKLQIIRQALQTEDNELLRAALHVLQLGNRSEAPAPVSPQVPPILDQGDPPQDEDVKQMQKDIDKLFNP